MKIIPSEKIEISTTYSFGETRKILKDNIRRKQGLTFGFSKRKEDKLFEGTFVDDKFDIQRIISGRNSFLPQINGEIQKDFNGSKLIASLKVHIFVIAFMIFWLGGVSFALVVITIGAIKQVANPIFIIVPIIMLVFGIGMVHFAFNREKKNSINDLKRILNGQIK